MRILILQLKRIGDLILTTPVLSALRESLPGAHLTIALDRSAASLAPALEAHDVLVFKRGSANPGFWKSIATSRPDVCLDFTGTDRSALAAALSRAKRRITFQRFARKPLRRIIFNQFVESSVRGRHTADHHTDLLQSLGITRENIPPRLAIPPEALARADALLAETGVSPRFAVIHPGTARLEKYWLPDRWAAVIGHLRDAHHFDVLLTGSPDSVELTHVARIQIALTAPCPSLAGRLDLLTLAAVLDRAALVCSVDSAPVHFADALGTPVVALFGPTNPFHWRPRNATARVVTPFGETSFSPDFHARPMDRIASDAVRTAIDELIPN
jgi:predicted lipopolysaccharide heptosyltransferase III